MIGERFLESELGVMSVPVYSAVSKGMRNTEHLWSRNMVKIMETACIENTNRIACGTIILTSDEICRPLLRRAYVKRASKRRAANLTAHEYNTLLHREGNAQSLKLRTMTDLCDRHGKEVEEYQERKAKIVLQSYGWNPETGVLQEGATAPEGILPPLKEGEETADSRIARGQPDCAFDWRHQ